MFRERRGGGGNRESRERGRGIEADKKGDVGERREEKNREGKIEKSRRKIERWRRERRE